MKLNDLQTPALLVEVETLEFNLAEMARALPGRRLRPHVKAHKSSSLAKLQTDRGHAGLTCATLREALGLAAAGLGEEVLIANEVLDARRLKGVDARITLAVDSEETIEAAAGAVEEVLIDVNVGLPRCGCRPEQAGRLADLARSKGLEVRGVMGYEGHVVGRPDRAERQKMTEECMVRLLEAHADVGGELISAGGTGTYDINTWATEIQAGSYVFMDTAYGRLDLPFRQSLSILGTVISVSPDHAVADCGLKSMGMDHGNPSVESGNNVWFVADEHIVFGSETRVQVGDRIKVIPAHCDPTVAYHEMIHLVRDEEVVDVWPIDLRGW